MKGGDVEGEGEGDVHPVLWLHFIIRHHQSPGVFNGSSERLYVQKETKSKNKLFLTEIGFQHFFAFFR